LVNKNCKVLKNGYVATYGEIQGLTTRFQSYLECLLMGHSSFCDYRLVTVFIIPASSVLS